eukprot:scaffold16009_cov24-Tisochrysis_lutea.AAC.1
MKAVTSDVYLHEMPGGQYTNLKIQANSLGLGGDWGKICKSYAAANHITSAGAQSAQRSQTFVGQHARTSPAVPPSNRAQSRAHPCLHTPCQYVSGYAQQQISCLMPCPTFPLPANDLQVTPSSKVVGDLAQFMVQNDLDETSLVAKAAELSFPSSVVGSVLAEVQILGCTCWAVLTLFFCGGWCIC